MKSLLCTIIAGAVGWFSLAEAQAAYIDGSLAVGPQANVNLTALGTEDWAVWGCGSGGTSTSLTPDVSLAGGSGISDLTYLNPNTQPLRGLGQFDVNFSFSWTNGNTTPVATDVYAGLQDNSGTGPGLGVGEGFSFTVPADTTERQVTVYVDEHEGIGQLTATLSDGSALAYSDSSVPTGANSAGVYTIDYAAASAGQTLTIEWMETGYAAPSDNAAIYAVALNSVPEPSTVALVALGGIGFLARWRRKQNSGKPEA